VTSSTRTSRGERRGALAALAALAIGGAGGAARADGAGGAGGASGAGSVGGAGGAGVQQRTPSGRPSADFALHDLGGRTVRLSDHRGKVVLLNFWATWCAPCTAEAPHLQRLYEAYRDRGLEILGISMDGPESVANVRAHVAQLGLSYPILLDEETRVVGVYNPKGSAPFTVLIGRDGRIASTRDGYSAGDERAIEADVAALLGVGEGAGAGGAGASASAGGGTRRPPIEITSTTTVGVRVGDDARQEMFEKLNVGASAGAWRVAARVDTATFVSEPSPAIADRYTVEKASVTYAGRALELTVGDAYVSFGRGLALSLRKVDELGIDTTLRGVKALVRGDRLEGTLVAGYANINNVDEATGKGADDPYDLIAGAQGQLRIAGGHLAGLYGSVIAFRDALGLATTDAYTDRAAQVGATFDAPRFLSHLADGVSLYLEGMVQSVSTDPAPDDPLAAGVYGTASWTRGPATVLVEGKAYGALTPLNPRLGNPFEDVAYHSPPTVERVLQPLENPQRDIAGGRVRFDWRFAPGLLAYSSYGAFRDWLGYADPRTVGAIEDGTIHDPYAGVELRWNRDRSWATAEGGYRTVVIDGAGAIRGDGHLKLDLEHALNRCYSLTLHGQHQERMKDVSPILSERFREGSIDAGVRAWGLLAVSAGYDYTTEPTQPKRDYFHGNVSWDITPSSSVRLFAGSARGGLRCVSGVCRVFPPFEGVKLTLTLRY
jgi:peroxiredoxin